MSKSLNFYATPKDLMSVLAPSERALALSYALAGRFDEAKTTVWESVNFIPSFGVAECGEQNQGKWYLILSGSVSLHFTPVHERDGSITYALDQRGNDASVVLRPGGIFDDEAIIAGQLGTTSSHPDALHTLDVLVRSMRKNFTRIKSYYVGSDAKHWLNAGKRLTTSLATPREYDLTAV